MKTREGYVSNSSNTSFLIAHNSLFDLEWIANKDLNAHEKMLNDMKALNEEEAEYYFRRMAIDFCSDIVTGICSCHVLRKKGTECAVINDDVKNKINDFCHMTNCSQEKVMEIVVDLIEKLKPQSTIRFLASKTDYTDFQFELGKLAANGVLSKWDTVSEVSYWYSDLMCFKLYNFMKCDENNGDKARLFIFHH